MNEKRVRQLIGAKCFEIYQHLKDLEFKPNHEFSLAVIEDLNTFNVLEELECQTLDSDFKVIIYDVFGPLLDHVHSKEFYFDCQLYPHEKYFLKRTFDVNKLWIDQFDESKRFTEKESYNLDWLNDPKEIEKLEAIKET